jgi:hypothetical protein
VGYNLTDRQKDLLRWIVRSVRERSLPEEFTIHWTMGEYITDEYRGKEDLPEMNPGILN